MSRPKSNKPGLSAKARIEEAFWQLLEEMPYSEISIKGLAARASVNHKTIYYYYENIDALAKHLFEENISMHFHEMNPLLAVLNGQPETYLRDNFETVNSKRIMLYSRSDSLFLNSLFKQYILKNWIMSIGIKEEELSEDEKLDLEFILSGMISLLGKDFTRENIQTSLRIFDRDLGKAVRRTFLQLKTKYNSI